MQRQPHPSIREKLPSITSEKVAQIAEFQSSLGKLRDIEQSMSRVHNTFESYSQEMRALSAEVQNVRNDVESALISNRSLFEELTEKGW